MVQPKWSGKRRDMTEKMLTATQNINTNEKISTQKTPQKDPYLETMLQLCASTGTQVYL